MTLSEYIDKYHYYKRVNDESFYSRIDVYPLNNMEIKNFINLDIINNKEIQNIIVKIIDEDKEYLIPSYYRESKTNVFLLLKDEFLEKELLINIFNDYFSTKKFSISDTNQLLDFLLASYQDAKKDTYIKYLKELQTEINDKIKELNDILL
jgi:hypothetical protein